MLAVAPPRSELIGSPTPRVGPPVPLRHGLAGYRQTAASIGIEPMPWQDTAATFLTAVDADDHWLYREVAIVVGRQNGKTTVVKPLVVERILLGRRVLLIAQVRELPRTMFEAIADIVEAEHPDLLPRRRGKVIWARRGAGSESIVLTNGGTLRIAAATTGAARGMDRVDDLIIDELLEAESFDVINAAKPTQRYSTNPQTIYLSNAGTDRSVVLNSLRKRGSSGEDPNLAYLEWSADPDYDASDRRGWVQADPAIGHAPQVLLDIERDYLAAELGGNMAGFEMEALCRWQPTPKAPVVIEATWADLRSDDLGIARRPMMAVSMDPSGTRASAVIAWRRDDEIAVRLIADVTGDPIDVDRFGTDLRDLSRQLGVKQVGFAPWTDADLARWFPNAKPLDGRTWAVASEAFARMVEGGKVHWDGTNEIGDDLAWTVRKPHEGGAWHAVKARDDRPITAALAAVRAVWLASDPKRPGSLRVQ